MSGDSGWKDAQQPHFMRGPVIFLILVFALGYWLQFFFLAFEVFDFRALGIVQAAAITAVFWIPAIAAVLAHKIAPDSLRQQTLQRMPAHALLRIIFAVFLVFALIHALPAVLGWSSPDWSFRTLATVLREQAVGAPPENLEASAPFAGLVLLPLLSLLLGATVFTAVALGNELGWRVYLGARLAPGGDWRKSFAVGLLWGLWLLPLVYAWHDLNLIRHEFPSFSVRFVILTGVVSVLLSRIQARTQSVLASALFLGVFLAQLQSHWTYLFPAALPPWTGPFGVVAIMVWVLVARFPTLFLGRVHSASAHAHACSVETDGIRAPEA